MNADPDTIAGWLAETDPGRVEALRVRAEAMLLARCGPEVRLRGLIEASNACRCDCLYCGIRKSNPGPRRYRLDRDTMVAAALSCAKAGYGSVVIQAGEDRSPAFIDLIAETVAAIKRESASGALPEGLGITLSLGEQEEETYRRWRRAGAHRYLLRIETSDPQLFARIHPPGQDFAARVEALRSLRRADFQVGTGVMIGLPGQTVRDLAGDVLFFRDLDVDMVGMGPWLPHAGTPMGHAHPSSPADLEARFRLSLLMIAAVRLVLEDANIASTTALETIAPHGRLEGLRFGANVVMPNAGPVALREDYALYDGKHPGPPDAAAFPATFAAELAAIGRRLARDDWGDAPHARRRQPAGWTPRRSGASGSGRGTAVRPSPPLRGGQGPEHGKDGEDQ